MVVKNAAVADRIRDLLPLGCPYFDFLSGGGLVAQLAVFLESAMLGLDAAPASGAIPADAFQIHPTPRQFHAL